MCGKLGAVFEADMNDEGEDSGSKRADKTAASFEVRTAALDCIVVDVAILLSR
jgi:hypothetical protein